MAAVGKAGSGGVRACHTIRPYKVVWLLLPVCLVPQQKEGTPWETMLQPVFHCAIWVTPDCPRFTRSGIPCSLSRTDWFAVAVALFVWEKKTEEKKKKKKERMAQVAHTSGPGLGCCFIYEGNTPSRYVTLTDCTFLSPRSKYPAAKLKEDLRTFVTRDVISVLADKLRFALCHLCCSITVNHVHGSFSFYTTTAARPAGGPSVRLMCPSIYQYDQFSGNSFWFFLPELIPFITLAQKAHHLSYRSLARGIDWEAHSFWKTRWERQRCCSVDTNT